MCSNKKALYFNPCRITAVSCGDRCIENYAMKRPCYFGVCYVEIKPSHEHLMPTEYCCVTLKVMAVNFDVR
jgi:hypothetical protein